MAKKFKKFLALTVALALCLGQIALPVMADESGQNITLNVDLSQIPESSDTMTVITGEPVAVASEGAPGITEQASSTTTVWNGTDAAGAQITGQETSTDFVGTDDATGKTLYEGGALAGSETSLHTDVSGEQQILGDQILSESEETIQVKEESGEIVTTEESTDTETVPGEWEYEEIEEGAPVADLEASDSSTTTDIPLDLPEPGDVTIQLTPNDPDGTTVTKVIPIEDVLAGIVVLPAEGEYTELKDEDGNVIGYEVITTGTSTDTVTTDSEPQTTEKTYTVSAEVSLPEGVQAGTEPVYAEDGTTVIGQVLTQIVPEYDASGKIIKYTITRTTTKNVEETLTEEATGETTKAEDSSVSILLPAKPAESVTADPDTGITTTVSVSELKDEAGKVIGYTVTTTLTDADGETIGTTTEKQYGTVVTTDTTTTVDPTIEETTTAVQEVTTEVTEITAETTVTETEMVTTRLNEYIETNMTRKDYAYVEIDGKLYFLYTGSMTATEGEDHGDTSLMNPVQPMDSLMNADKDQDLNKGGDNVVEDTSAPEEGFKYIGHGIDPSLSISKGNDSSNVVQFRLKSSDGKEYYALCIDFNTTIQDGHMYDIQDITSEEYYQQEGNLDIETAEKIRSVALNGYWGTSGGVGSMTDVKAFLKTYLTGTLEMAETEAQAIVDSLTHGQAVAATQAALWKFGNKDGRAKVNEENLVPNGWEETWTQNRWGNWEKDYVKTEDYTNTEYLYDALLAAANDPTMELEADEGVEFLDAEDVTGGAITVKSKVVDNASNQDANPDNDVYNTDVSFTLGIEPSKLNGDLIVTVTVGDKQVKKVRLAGEDVNFSLLRITADENGVYTIPDVEIAEGVKVNLNLSGTQDLGTGVYIYTSLEGTFNDSQTLVTLATGSRKVNLDMSMNFNVEEPDATANLVEGYETSVVRTVDTQQGSKKDVTTVSDTKTTTAYSNTYTADGTVRKTVYADVTIDKITTEETKTEWTWDAFWKAETASEDVEVTEPTDPVDPTQPEPTETDPTETEPTEPEITEPTDPVPLDVEEEPVIPDAEVPLAQAPKTGDVSLIWVALSGLSASGLVVLNRKRED